MKRRARAFARISAGLATRGTPLATWAAAAAVVGGLTGSALPAAAAPAWSEGACPTADGVTVVVDFQGLGGGVVVRCAPGSSASGLDALARAGIGYQTTIRFPGFVCRIGGVPASDPCIDTSPANAHWGYWIAQRGGSWCLSNHGAGARVPGPGAVEGWSFSLNNTQATAPAPRFTVPSAVAGGAPLGGGACSNAAPNAATSNPATSTPATSAPKPTTSTATTSTATAAPASPAAVAGPVDNGPAVAGSGAARPTDRGASRSGEAPDVVATPSTPNPSAVDSGATSDTPGEAQIPVERAPADATTPVALDAVGGDDDGHGDDGHGDEDRDAALAIDGNSRGDEGSPVGVIAAGSLIGAGSLVAAVMRKRGRAG